MSEFDDDLQAKIKSDVWVAAAYAKGHEVGSRAAPAAEPGAAPATYTHGSFEQPCPACGVQLHGEGLPSVNFRHGVPFGYCPDCGTEQHHDSNSADWRRQSRQAVIDAFNDAAAMPGIEASFVALLNTALSASVAAPAGVSGPEQGAAGELRRAEMDFAADLEWAANCIRDGKIREAEGFLRAHAGFARSRAALRSAPPTTDQESA